VTCDHVHIGDACVMVCRSTFTYRRRVRDCPTCKRRRRFVLAVDDNPYYGSIWTCCGCGDSWSDGERMPRPFARGWRARAIAKAKARWVA
jgi:hypothetical protein